MESLVTVAKQRFFSALSNTFLGEVGTKLEGTSGYTNLMRIRNEYFKHIKPLIEEVVDNEFLGREQSTSDLYNKLYTFFESYLNETGTPFYNKTQLHKNLYEKVYSDKEDLALFWKTQRLYYVKTEATYTSINFDIGNYRFEFDASELEHQKNNEKKEIEFHLVETDENTLKFKVFYKDGATKKYDRLKEYLSLNSSDAIKDYFFDNIDTFKHPNIQIEKNKINLEHFKSKTAFRKIVNVRNIDDFIETVIVSLSVSGFEDILNYLERESYTIDEELLKKAFNIFKKQNEVDYFIHKDASKFLKEQFNQFIYDYLFNDQELNTLWSQDRIIDIQKLKKIAYDIIDYIALFEDELKEIWLKPKFVLNSDYVLTLGKINDVELIEKIVNSDDFEKQIKEWQDLYNPIIDPDNNRVIKREWKEFEFSFNFDKSKIIVENEQGVKTLNEEYVNLPIDTKNFKELKYEILSSFDNIEEQLDGVLIKSENYQALNTILKKYRGEVELIYIDPPFNTGEDFDYKDNYQDSTWLTLMNERLELSYELLAENGSLFLHLGEDASYYGRILLNRIFGKESYLNNLIWAYTLIGGNAKKWERNHEYITWFAKNPKNYIFNKDLVRQPYSEKFLKDLKPNEKGELVYSRGAGRDGERLNRKKESKINPLGKAPSDVWNDISYIPPSTERMGFGTQKPEELLYRIIAGASNDGYVLDFFTGSGTTISVAHKLGRKWIGVEMGDHFYGVVLPRLKKVLFGDEETKVSKKAEYRGGGFFKYYELEQYEDVLKKAKYNSNEESPINIFYDSEKLLDAVKIEENSVKVVLQELYPNVDIPETISNITGKRISHLNQEQAIFEDGSIIDLNNMLWEEHKYLRPLIWWGAKNGK
jgi:adenine-specific DNA-methyltransferase